MPLPVHQDRLRVSNPPEPWLENSNSLDELRLLRQPPILQVHEHLAAIGFAGRLLRVQQPACY
eukprot:7918658-Pyramimonas_sp.AAC.1